MPAFDTYAAGHLQGCVTQEREAGPEGCRLVLKNAFFQGHTLTDPVYVTAPQPCTGRQGQLLQAKNIRLESDRGWRHPSGSLLRLMGTRYWRAFSREPVDFSGHREQEVRPKGSLSPESQAFLDAIVWGDRAGLSRRTRDAFIDTGLAHLLAISGLHMGIVAWSFYTLALLGFCTVPRLRHAGFPNRWAAASTVVMVWLFVAEIAPSPATLRAGIVITVFLLGRLIGRRSDPILTLMWAATLLLVHDPEVVLSASFQLSFFAAFGIIFAHRNLSHVLAARETDELTRWNRLGRRLLSLLVLNMAAWCVTTPLCLAHFGTSSPAGLIVNAGFLPLASLVVIPLSFVYAGMCRFLPSLADFLQPAIDGVIGAFLDGVDGWFEMVPSSQTSTIGHWEGIAVALAVLGVLHRPTRRRMLLLALCVFHSLSQAPGDTSPLRISMFDVGHGDAALIQTPEGGTMLVDSGGSGRSTARNSHLADRIVVPSMARLGASRIDVAVVTHPHADHMGALERIAERFRIGALWIGPCGHEDPLMRRLASRVRSQGGSVHVVTRGHQDTWAGIQLRVLWPPPDVLRPNGSCRYGLNDASVVLQVTYAGRRVLMVGDLERKGEEGLLALEPNLESTLLKVGHHGSKTSTSTRFLDSVNPAYSVISGTLRPGRFPPHSDIIRRLHEGNILTWITGRDGAVTFDIDQEGHVVPFGYPSGRTLRVP